MKSFWTSLLLNWLLLLAVDKLVPGIQLNGWAPALLGALVLAGVNTLVRPVVLLLTLPVTVLTLGGFLLVINALMFMLAAALVPGFSVASFGAALLGSLVFSALHWVVSRSLKTA